MSWMPMMAPKTASTTRSAKVAGEKVEGCGSCSARCSDIAWTSAISAIYRLCTPPAIAGDVSESRAGDWLIPPRLRGGWLPGPKAGGPGWGLGSQRLAGRQHGGRLPGAKHRRRVRAPEHRGVIGHAQPVAFRQSDHAPLRIRLEIFGD